MYDVFRDFAGPGATLPAVIAAAWVAIRFGRSQAGIAHQQMELAAAKLRHDLYDKQFAIYASARDLLFNIHCGDDAVNDALMKFLKSRADAIFLLDRDLIELLDQMAIRAMKLDTLNSRIASASNSDRLESLYNEKEELMTWLDGKFNLMAEKFRSLLSLDNIQLQMIWTS
jgi:hypothetical protein